MEDLMKIAGFPIVLKSEVERHGNTRGGNTRGNTRGQTGKR
jgi:hypothetical protein